MYYPLTVDPTQRDDLRHYLLRYGIDTKMTDMSDCVALATFGHNATITNEHHGAVEASILEFCVYPDISGREIQHIAHTIRAWPQSRAASHRSLRPTRSNEPEDSSLEEIA